MRLIETHINDQGETVERVVHRRPGRFIPSPSAPRNTWRPWHTPGTVRRA